MKGAIALKTLKVELFGLARRLAQSREVEIQVGDTDTYKDVIASLVQKFPAFVGQIVHPETHGLMDPYFLNVDARRVVHDLDEIPEEGKPLLLLLVDAGG